MKIRLEKVALDLPGSGRRLFQIPKLEIHSGSKVLIVGPSGHGKTTLLHLMAGLMLPTEGEVYLDEHRLGALSDEARCDIRRGSVGIVFQKLNLLEHLTVRENVLLALPPSSGGDAEALKALEQVGMKDHADQRSSVLSLGEQQRVAVARVLARRPAITLADEPTSSLDEKNADAVIEALFAASEGRTLVVVSHDQRIRKRFSEILEFDQWVKR